VPIVVEFHPDARDELQAAVTWYDAEHAGLGAVFASAVERTIRQAASAPAAGTPIGPDLRRWLVPSFPYAILCAVEPALLRVMAIAHFRRRPDYWKARR
jgi:toxin ParE1/3/4